MSYLVILMLLFSMNCFSQDSIIKKVDPAKKQITIELPSNPTTGYKWTLLDYNHSVLQLSDTAYTQKNNAQIGASGVRRYVFSVKAGDVFPIQTKLIFKYARPWDKQSGNITRMTIQFSTL